MRSRPSPARLATAALFTARTAYGVALVAAPERVAGGRWLGPGAGHAPAQVAIRGLGAREVALHLAGIVAVVRGAPVRPWLITSMAGDVADVLSTAAGREDLPDGSAPATHLTGSAARALRVDRDRGQRAEDRGEAGHREPTSVDGLRLTLLRSGYVGGWRDRPRGPRAHRTSASFSSSTVSSGIGSPGSWRFLGLAQAAQQATKKVAQLAKKEKETDLVERLDRMTRESADTEKRCQQVADSRDGLKTAIKTKARETKAQVTDFMKTYLEGGDALDGLEFLSMSEAGELAHWEILATLNETAKNAKVGRLVDHIVPVQQAHVAAVRESSLRLAAAEDPAEAA